MLWIGVFDLVALAVGIVQMKQAFRVYVGETRQVLMAGSDGVGGNELGEKEKIQARFYSAILEGSAALVFGQKITIKDA